MTEADAWAAYEAAINRQYDHPKACDRCMAPLSAEVQPGSLLSVFAAPCDVAVRLDAETEAAHDAWLKAHADAYRKMGGLMGGSR